MKKQKKTNSILAGVLQAENRPIWPAFVLIVFFAIILDAIRLVFSFILHLIVILAVTSLVLMSIVYIKVKPEYDSYMAEAAQVVAESSPEDFRYNERTIIYDADGTQMTQLLKDSDTVYLKYQDIPVNVINAFVAVENRTFWEDPGVDWKSIARVVYDALITRGAEVHGASTITQQLARAVFLNNGVTLDRKLKEMALSVKLTEKYSKQQIMEFYVNNVYFANGFYGLEAASQGYFSIPSDKLTLSQAAYLCAIPNSPTFYDPYNDPERAVDRRDHILESMYEVGFISWSDLEEAKAEKIEINPGRKTGAGYEATYASECAIRYFMKLDQFPFQYHFESDEDRSAYEEKYQAEYSKMYDELREGGYRIYTSINPVFQQKLQDIADTYIASKKTDNTSDLQTAMTLIDDKGKVLAIIGGTTEARSDYGLNRAFQSTRQPGSSIKPLIIYGAALQSGYTPDSIVKDISVSEALEKEKARVQFGTPYAIKEMGGTDVTLRYALEQSLNGVAYYILDDLGVYQSLPLLEQMHYKNIVHDDYTMSAALGGFTYGATSEEMAGAYHCLASGGQYIEPTCITSIIDRYGNEIYKEDKSEKVYDRSAIRNLRSMMEGVMIRGTAAKLHWYNDTDIKAYVKTGTTDNQKDGWLCGWTETKDNSYTLAVWVGCDMPKKLDGLWGATWPGEIWKESMLAVIDGESPRESSGEEEPEIPEESAESEEA